MTVNVKNIIDKAQLADDFMEIMEDYQDCQRDNPNFNSRQALQDLYEELSNLYNDNINP
tara:strand:+ start:600 stop:776 length:177 start_codon:yes stop_codon:yes gene_type:complete